MPKFVETVDTIEPVAINFDLVKTLRPENSGPKPLTIVKMTDGSEMIVQVDMSWLLNRIRS